MNNAQKITLFLTACTSLYSTAAVAQNVPSSVNPSQVERRFKQSPAMLEQMSEPLPLPGEPKDLSPAMQAQLEKVKFTLSSVSVEGATVYSNEDFAKLYSGMVGQKISLLDAQTLARKITDMYRRDGYVLSQAVVPQQTVSGGQLKIRVVEGYISNVVIQGDVASDSAREVIRGYAENIKAMRPVRSQDLEKYLLLINDLPGASVSGLLRPAVGQVGAADMVLTMQNKKYEASYSFDNRGSEFIGPWQHNVTLTANSLLGNYDRTQLRLITSTPFVEMKGFELQHDEQIGTQGTKLSLLVSHTHTEPGDTLKNVNIVGNSRLYEVKVAHPFIRSRQTNLVGRALFDFQDSDTDVFKTVDYTQDRLRIARLGGYYSFGDSLRGNNAFDLEVSKGLNIFNASEQKGLNRTNANGDSDFTKFTLDASRLQPLPDKFSLMATAKGQYSLNPLFVSEQFALGGSAFGGAYDSAEILGDHGIAGKLELRYSDSVGEKYLNSYQLYTYYDIGRAWIREGAAGANDKLSLATAGLGVRTNFTDSVSGTLEVAQPLTKPVKNQGGHGEDPRVFFGTSVRF